MTNAALYGIMLLVMKTNNASNKQTSRFAFFLAVGVLLSFAVAFKVFAGVTITPHPGFRTVCTYNGTPYTAQDVCDTVTETISCADQSDTICDWGNNWKSCVPSATSCGSYSVTFGQTQNQQNQGMGDHTGTSSSSGGSANSTFIPFRAQCILYGNVTLSSTCVEFEYCEFETDTVCKLSQAINAGIYYCGATCSVGGAKAQDKKYKAIENKGCRPALTGFSTLEECKTSLIPASTGGASEIITGTSTAVTSAVNFADLEGKVKNKKTLDAILRIAELMQNKTFLFPKFYYPNKKVSYSFAARIALILAGKDCGGQITSTTCNESAQKAGLLTRKDFAKKAITLADMYSMFFKAASVSLISQADITPDYLCKDVDKPDSQVEVIATARKFGVAIVDKNGKCNPNAAVSKANAAVIADKILNINKK